MSFLKQFGRWIGFFVGFMALIVFLEYMGSREFFARWFHSDLQPWLDNNPMLAPIVFVGTYVLSVLVMIPGTIMTVAGGALFGPIRGTLYVSLGSITGAGLAFLISRYLAADWVENNTGDRLLRIKEGIERDGWEFVAITRLVPIFPFNLLNYAYGLTRINFWTHLWVSGISMLPATFAYVYAGYVGRELFTGELGLLETIIIVASALGLLILIGLIPRWIRRFNNNEISTSL